MQDCAEPHSLANGISTNVHDDIISNHGRPLVCNPICNNCIIVLGYKSAVVWVSSVLYISTLSAVICIPERTMVQLLHTHMRMHIRTHTSALTLYMYTHSGNIPF